MPRDFGLHIVIPLHAVVEIGIITGGAASTPAAQAAADQPPPTQATTHPLPPLPTLPHADMATPSRTLPEGYDLAPSPAVSEDTISDDGNSYAVHLVLPKSSIETGLDMRMRMSMAVRIMHAYHICVVDAVQCSRTQLNMPRSSVSVPRALIGQINLRQLSSRFVA